MSNCKRKKIIQSPLVGLGYGAQAFQWEAKRKPVICRTQLFDRINMNSFILFQQPHC